MKYGLLEGEGLRKINLEEEAGDDLHRPVVREIYDERLAKNDIYA